MIGYLNGVAHAKMPGQAMVLVNGVGYVVNLPLGRWQRLRVGEPVETYTYCHVREDCLELYGFESLAELEMFKLVLSVPGVGPKTALGVIERGWEAAQRAVREADMTFFEAVPRLGRKNAQKIIIELRGKLGGIEEVELIEASVDNQEAVEALRSMGFTKAEAIRAIKEVPAGEKSLEARITWALRQMGRAKKAVGEEGANE